MRRRLLVGAALLAAAGGVGLQWAVRKLDSEGAATRELWAMPLSDLDGKPQGLGHWQGQVLVLNFWATWCAPCREEVPALVRIQDKYASNGVQIVGISLDSAAKVREFAKEFKIQYTLLVGGLETIDYTRKIGNPAAGLPYTVVLSKSGRIAARHLGGITEAQLDAALTPLVGRS